MPTLVVPFRGAPGKSRLAPLPQQARLALTRAMLADVVAACAAVGPTLVVGPIDEQVGAAELVPDPGGGQGAAVRAGLDAATAGGSSGPFLVVNADLPCVTPRDLFTLAGAVPEGGLALVSAADGTTNALALATADVFAPVYGPGSAARFAALAPARMLDIAGLIDDVDTVDHLERLRSRLGRHTRSALASLRLGAAA
jgi:2-phospho-L-lactate guanylyltransferase (CobY/MobA/RfbA family)